MNGNVPEIFVVSGGQGTSGERIVRSTLAQFKDVDIPVHIIGEVRTEAQVEAIIERAAANNCLIVHTLVDSELRSILTSHAHAHNLVTIDLQGQLLLHLARMLGQQPIGQPGLYHRLREPYFKRIDSMEFAIDHDDGKRIEDLHLAEVVLTGVSRVGKTPLSIYLSMQGWRVANVPLMREVQPPKKLFEIDNRRVVGLNVDPGQLVQFRQFRQQRMGLSLKNTYSRPEDLVEEVEFARQVFRRGRFLVVDVTDRPIEESAEEIIARVTRRLRDAATPR
jgi:hypothetical protein